MDYEIHRCTRRCAASQRELAEGEVVYSLVKVRGADLVREDYSAECWQGPPEDALGWWRSRIPGKADAKAKLAPGDVLLKLFRELEDVPDKQDMRYVLALLLVRRRSLRPEETGDDGPARQLHLFCPRDETQHVVNVIEPGQERIEQIQNELAALLYAEPG
jgi:hypothetical protein